MRRLWPRSLAGRLVLLLVAALAVAQLSLVLVLRGEQRAIIDGIVHGQALTQTVTLARLLAAYPPGDGPKLASAFGSRQSCAILSDTPLPPHAMSETEAGLAHMLTGMLHGVEAGPPDIAIEPVAHGANPCAGSSPYGGTPSGLRDGGDDADVDHDHRGGERLGVVAVAMSVPLTDGRTLTIRSGVDVPTSWNRLSLFSFLLSSLAVVLVVIVAVKTQTRSLRSLAEASDRFGRGEAVAPLAESGPSEVAAAIRAFNTMQVRLSSFIRDRLRLLAGISHDLRTPLTTLRLKAEFIDDETVRDGIVATIDELTVICEATLAFTRAEATSEATVTVPLDRLAGEVVEEFRLAGADVALQAAPVVYACRPVALKRALRNLVENAVRYGGGARVGVTSGNDAIAITVDDDGPGLPPDRIEEAFQPFVRLEPSRNTETGGIGLGLAIARGIVAAHGGTLTLENREGGGLRASIGLPRSDQ